MRVFIFVRGKVVNTSNTPHKPLQFSHQFFYTMGYRGGYYGDSFELRNYSLSSCQFNCLYLGYIHGYSEKRKKGIWNFLKNVYLKVRYKRTLIGDSQAQFEKDYGHIPQIRYHLNPSE